MTDIKNASVYLLAKKWLALPKEIQRRNDPTGMITDTALDFIDEEKKKRRS
ncbi:MAG: hypothetical protein QXO60_00085 [Candidatus Micrarchaeia archaeon]